MVFTLDQSVKYNVFSQFLVEEMYMDQQNTGGTNAKSILMDIARTLEAEDLKAFIKVSSVSQPCTASI